MVKNSQTVKNFYNNLGALTALLGTEETNRIVKAMESREEAIEILRACLDRLTEMGYSIHEVGLPQTISILLSKMED